MVSKTRSPPILEQCPFDDHWRPRSLIRAGYVDWGMLLAYLNIIADKV
jgi:hypothetical protein